MMHEYPKDYVDPEIEEEVERRMGLPDWALACADACPSKDYERLLQMLERGKDDG